MKLFGVLVILALALCTAHGLKCYLCATTDAKSCTNSITCSGSSDRCFSTNVAGAIAKGCIDKALCISPVSCCDGDLCNSAGPTGSSVLLLLVSSALITLFL